MFKNQNSLFLIISWNATSDLEKELFSKVQRFYADTDIFLFWSYGNSIDIMGPMVTELAVNPVKNMGGEVEKGGQIWGEK
jgi:hypothetical protein